MNSLNILSSGFRKEIKFLFAVKNGRIIDYLLTVMNEVNKLERTKIREIVQIISESEH